MSEGPTPESVAEYVLRDTQKTEDGKGTVSETFDANRREWEGTILEAETSLGYKIYSQEHMGSTHPLEGGAMAVGEHATFKTLLLLDREGDKTGREILDKTAGARERLNSSIAPDVRDKILFLYKATYAEELSNHLKGKEDYGSNQLKAVESIFEMVDAGKLGNAASREIVGELILSAGAGAKDAGGLSPKE